MPPFADKEVIIAGVGPCSGVTTGAECATGIGLSSNSLLSFDGVTVDVQVKVVL